MTKSNFGRYGWYLIVFSGFLYFLSSGLSADGQNVYVSAFAEKNGWDPAVLLGYASVAGYISIAGTVFLGWLIGKKGARFVMSMSLFVSGAAAVYWGYADVPIEYFIALTVILLFTNAFSFISAATLADSFFPRKKGLALGWATIGMNLSSVAVVPLLALLFAAFGLEAAYTLIGVVMVVLGVVAAATVRNAPEELGLRPDNEEMTDEQFEYSKRALEEYDSPWRMKDFLKVRETWLIGAVFGIQFLCATGILSQFVPRTVSLGVGQDRAITMFSLAATGGIFGSYFWGWLDMKIGIKKASIAIMLWYTAATFFFVLPPSIPLIVAGAAMLGFSLGGTASLSSSFTGTVFGRYEFGRVIGLVNPVMSALRMSAFALLSLSLNMFGDYAPVYKLFFCFAVAGIVLMLFIRPDFRASPQTASGRPRRVC
jgi:sugar phosphate permease